MCWYPWKHLGVVDVLIYSLKNLKDCLTKASNGIMLHLSWKLCPCFGTHKMIGVKEVHSITNSFDRDERWQKRYQTFTAAQLRK